MGRIQVNAMNEAAPFATTHWSVVLGARDGAQLGEVEGEDPRVSEALARLCQVYWPPLFAYLRRQGYAPHDAEDLVQGFFERLLAEGFLREVGREKGRFRSFLLAALRHHVANVHRHRKAQRRGGGRVPVAIDDPEVADRCQAAVSSGAEAELIYDRLWAETILAQAAASLRREYVESGRREMYEVLRVWLAAEAAPGDYATAAGRLGMSEGAVAVAVHRLRQLYRRRVRDQVANTVAAPDQIGEEMAYLFRILSSM